MAKHDRVTDSTTTNDTQRGASRRDFLHWTAGAGLAAASCGSPEPAPETTEPAAPTFSAPLGAELYTVRNELPDQAEEVLTRLAEIGFIEIEYGWNWVKTALPLLKDVGLHPISVSIASALVTGNWPAGSTPGESLDEIAAQAKEAGAEYMMHGNISADERGELDVYREFAEEFNRAGETARKHGLRLCYHNHAFEFDPSAGQKPYDVLIERFDPELAFFEVDVFWVSVGGEDPVDLLKRLTGRVPMLHLKDLAKGAEIRYNENLAPEDFTEAGNGTVDFAAVLRQAPDSGVKHYFVEQDFTPGDPIDSLRQSYQHLRTLTV